MVVMKESSDYHPFKLGDRIKLRTNRKISRRVEYINGSILIVTRLDSYTNAQARIVQGRGYHKEKKEWYHPGDSVLVYLDAFIFSDEFKIWF